MKSIRQKIDILISEMTLDEKLAQIGSYWMYLLQEEGKLSQKKLEEKLSLGIGQITRVSGSSVMDPVTAAKTGNQIQKFLLEQTRLKIPAILHEEACSGAMLLGGTTYPQMIGLASTFQPELAEEMTKAIRKQLLAIGARLALAPVLDVSRDPRWGRTEETFGEDPTLVSHFGTSYIRGLQSDNIKDGVIATGKHFIGYSLSNGGLNCGPTPVGWCELYNNFLGPFQAAVRDAKLAAMMHAYIELDQEVVAASKEILTDLLRGELGFDGLLISDYDAIEMLNNFHFIAENKSIAGKLAIEAGIDVELPALVCYGEPLKMALEAGDLSIKTINTAVSRHLQKKFELGLFEHPYVDEGKVLEVYETDEQRSLARKIAQQSMVLLKNDGILPLSNNIKKLAVIGPNADNGRSQLGDYSYAATKDLMCYQAVPDSGFVNLDENLVEQFDIEVISLLDGIKQAVSAETEIIYAKGCENLDPDMSGFDEAVKAANESDMVVLVLGDVSGLVPDCTTGEFRDKVDLKLPGVQKKLAKAIFATGKPVVVVLVNGRPYSIQKIDQAANAVLEAWLPGEEGGNAVADVLFGKVNPGGKLPITFPRHVGQVPIYYNHTPSGSKSHMHIDYVDETVKPLYAFGHGLSYTEFEYSDLQMDKTLAPAGETVNISLTVSNTGKLDGEEIVQLYVRDQFGSSPRPVKELKGYKRASLKQGQSKKITFALPVNQLAFYDNDLDLIVESGKIDVMIGGASDKINLRSEFEITGEGNVEIKNRVFVCPVSVE